MNDEFRHAFQLSRTNRTALAELEALLAHVDAMIAAELTRESEPAGCLGGGGCCKFDLYGHRLYVTPLELALLARMPAPHPRQAARGRCPWQEGPTCSAHAWRPLGCRTFFCWVANAQTYRDLHEQTHRQVQAVHQRHCIPCCYGELPAVAAQVLFL